MFSCIENVKGKLYFARVAHSATRLIFRGALENLLDKFHKMLQKLAFKQLRL